MNVLEELQKLKAYREQLRVAAKPGLGPLEFYRNFILSDEAEDVLVQYENAPEPLVDCSDSYKVLLFDYFVAIPLQSVLQCRHRFNNEHVSDELDALKQQLQILVNADELSQDDLSLLPDLFHHLTECPPDVEPQDKQFYESATVPFREAIKILVKPGREDAILNIFKRIMTVGQDAAVVCLLNKQAGVYRSFEWEIIEGILRSPIFPDFFSECELKAGTPEIPYEYRNWPERSYFLQETEKGKGVTNYFILRSEVLKDFETDEGYKHFQDFMDYVARCGEINCDAYMEALLQLFTGFRFESASRVVKWNGKNVRVLFYILKYISNEKGRYQKLQPYKNVIFPCIDSTDATYFIGTDVDPGNRLQNGKGIPDNVIASLHNYYDFFPACNIV